MTTIPETSTFDATVYEWATTDPVRGGDLGIAVTPIKNLTNRTRWLFDQLALAVTAIGLRAPLASPALSGVPSAPTPAAGDNGPTVATTAFVNNSRSGVATVNVAGNSNVTLTAAQYGCGVIIFTGALTGNINVIFPVNGDWTIVNNTSGGYTVTCKTAGGSGVVVGQGYSSGVFGDGTNILRTDTDLSGKSMGKRDVYIQNGGSPSGGNNGDIFLIY